jgi:hypothetical protein
MGTRSTQFADLTMRTVKKPVSDGVGVSAAGGLDEPSLEAGAPGHRDPVATLRHDVVGHDAHHGAPIARLNRASAAT